MTASEHESSEQVKVCVQMNYSLFCRVSRSFPVLLCFAAFAQAATNTPPSGIRSGGGFYSGGGFTGFGSIGQPFVSKSHVLSATTASAGHIFVLFGPPWSHTFDSNGDGIPNWWCELHAISPFGPSLANEPTSNPVYNHQQAFIANLNPHDPSAVPRLWQATYLQSDSVMLEWLAMVNRTYRVYVTSDISAPVGEWTPYGAPVFGTGTITQMQIDRGSLVQPAYFAITVELAQ